MLEDSILIVDDDLTIRNMFASFFGNAGYKIYVAESAEEAIPIMEQAYCHLIFIDIDLPGMNGIELCKTIRKSNLTSVLTAITGFGPLYNKEECKAAGFNYYFKKPIRLEKLLKLAKHVFEEKPL